MHKFIMILILSISCSHKSTPNNKVTIIKQWHLSPKTLTTDIGASTGLPQYLNQSKIYRHLYKEINDGQNITIIAEGCDSGTVIDEKFMPTYNGWNAQNLKPHRDQMHYSEILTFLPLKLKVQFPEDVTAVCGDSEILARENQFALSEAKGFLGFYVRLKENKDSNPKKYDGYLKALESTEKLQITYPIEYSKVQALKNLDKFNELIIKRNAVLAETAKEHITGNPVIIVGGLHAKNLEEQLKNSGFEVEIITPEGYPSRSDNLSEEFKELLESGRF